VFDSRRPRLVLFGGRSGQTLLTDTWEWDGTSWSQKSGAGPKHGCTPSVRSTPNVEWCGCMKV
jgi:hypothetical protein